MVFSLATRSLRNDGARIFSAMLGVAAAVGLLSWHVGMATSAVSYGREAARKAAAPFDAWISGPAEGGGFPRGAPDAPKTIPAGGGIGQTPTKPVAEPTGGRRMFGRALPLAAPLVEAVARADKVAAAIPLATLGVTIDIRPGGHVVQGPPFRGNLAVLPEAGIPFAVGPIEGRLPDPASAVPEVVANAELFGSRVPKPALDSEMPLVLSAGTATLKIVGFFRASAIVQAFPSLYANPAAMAAVAARSPDFNPRPNLLLVRMADGADPGSLGKVVDATPNAGPCRLYTVDSVAARFRSDTVKNLLSSIPMTLTLALIAASCLLATVLMIGLSTRRRRIAELRCVGLTSGGVVRLVCFEAALAIVPGWLLGLGAAAVLLQLFLLGEAASGDMPRVIHFGWQTPVSSLVFALVVGLFATIAPIFSAMRVRPLEALGGDVTQTKPVSPAKAAAALLLLLPMPLLSFESAIPERTKTILMFAVGFPCFIAAIALGMHPLMRLVERLFLRPLGWALRLDPRLLQRRLSRDPARASGTVLTLAFGLGGFMAVHIWGGTLMSSFVPSPEWPDAIVSILPNGFSPEQVDLVRTCPGIAGGKVLAIDCSQKPFDPDGPAFKGREETIPKGVVLLFGTDPAAAFGGERPFAPFRFVEGDAASAVAAMESGRGCVIVSMLARLAGLKKGDVFKVAGRELEVAAVVDLNWHMVTSRALVRSPFGAEAARAGRQPPARTIGTAFVSEKFVREITGNGDTTYFLWVGMTPELQALGGLKATVRLDGEIRAAVKPDGLSSIKVHHRDEIADGTLAHGSDILGTMARIPLWSLVVTSTGIAALLVASVRGSKREFEVMRAIGATRSQLRRLVFGEAMLVTLCALVLSLVGGLLVGWSFTGLSRWVWSAGLPIRLVVPWLTIGKGVALAAVLCSAMAALPLSRLVR